MPVCHAIWLRLEVSGNLQFHVIIFHDFVVHKLLHTLFSLFGINASLVLYLNGRPLDYHGWSPKFNSQHQKRRKRKEDSVLLIQRILHISYSDLNPSISVNFTNTAVITPHPSCELTVHAPWSPEAWWASLCSWGLLSPWWSCFVRCAPIIHFTSASLKCCLPRVHLTESCPPKRS